MKKVYTVIGYDAGKADWYDRCGNREPGRDSEFFIKTFTEKDLVANEMGKLMFNYSEMEVTLLINGISYDDSHLLENEERDSHEKEIDDIMSLAYEVKSNLEDEKKKKDIEIEIEKKRLKEMQELKEKREQELKERELLSILTKKYSTEFKMNTELNKEQQVISAFKNIKILESEEKSLKEPLEKQLKEISSSYNKKYREYESFLEKMKEKYSDYAHDIAIENGECPRSRSGGYLMPNEVIVSMEGLSLEWVEERAYGCDRYEYYKVSWTDLFDYEMKLQKS